MFGTETYRILRFIPLLNLYLWPEAQVSGPFLIMPDVSVIIPVYNRPVLIAQAVSSVLKQSLEAMEIIIINDGSTDETAAVLQNLRDKDKRIKLINLPHSGYPGYVRNYGVSQSDSSYIAFLDSDDLWLEHKLDLQLRQLKDSKLVISHTREKWIRNGVEISQSSQKHKREGNVFNEALKKCMMGPSTVMMNTSYYRSCGGFREDLEIAEDYDLWIRITARENVHYIDSPLTVKRAGHGEQLSEKYGQIEIFRIQVLQKLLHDQIFLKHQKEEILQELLKKAAIYANGCRKRGRPDEALYYERLVQFS